MVPDTLAKGATVCKAPRLLYRSGIGHAAKGMADMATVPAADAAIVAAILELFVSGWNGGDARAWAPLFAEDATFVNVMGGELAGREAIISQHATLFAGMFKGTVLESAVSTDVIVADAANTVSQLRALPPGLQMTEPGLLRTRLRHVLARGGLMGWQIVATQNTPIPPKPAAPPPRSP